MTGETLFWIVTACNHRLMGIVAGLIGSSVQTERAGVQVGHVIVSVGAEGEEPHGIDG